MYVCMGVVLLEVAACDTLGSMNLSSRFQNKTKTLAVNRRSKCAAVAWLNAPVFSEGYSLWRFRELAYGLDINYTGWELRVANPVLKVARLEADFVQFLEPDLRLYYPCSSWRVQLYVTCT
jgi:hypothetical protein